MVGTMPTVWAPVTRVTMAGASILMSGLAGTLSVGASILMSGLAGTLSVGASILMSGLVGTLSVGARTGRAVV